MYATSGIHCNLTKEAWPRLHAVFQADSVNTPDTIPHSVLPVVDRLPKDILRVSLVDVLVLGSLTPHRLDLWRKKVLNTPTPPKVIIETWDEDWILKDTGPMSKSIVTRWSQAHYATACKLVDNLQIGGVVDKTWLVVVQERETTDSKALQWVWPRHLPEPTVHPFANCANCL
jgi:hypothetical protein